MALRTLSIALALTVVTAPVLGAQQGRVVMETEPNDDIAHAQVIQIGDTISGTKTYQNIDFFAYDLPAGAIIVVSVPYRSFCAGIALYDPDGTALASTDCFSDSQPVDSLTARTTRAGRYYVSIVHPADVETPGDEGRISPYKLRLGLYAAPPPGPGNPLTRLAATGQTIEDEVAGMVAAPNGDLIVAQSSRLSRVTPSGAVSIFASGVNLTGQIAIDALGDLLVPGGDADGAVVWRFDLKTGARTTFTRPPAAQHAYYGITIGANGDVWLSTPGGNEGATFVRFDAFGNHKSQVSSVGVRTFALTTAQNGELFYVAQNTGDVYRLANNTTPVRVISGTSAGVVPVSGEVALDQDGWLYIYNRPQGKLLLYNAQYQLAYNPLAQVLDSAGWKAEHLMAGPAWMRDRNGKMTPRLLVTRAPGRDNDGQGPREILVTDHRGQGAPGADPTLQLKKKSLRNGAINVAYADTLQLDGGTATWAFVSGQIPDGLSLSGAGVLTGTPSKKGTFEFLVRATNGPRAGFGRFSITVGDAPPVQVSVNDITNALMGGATLPANLVQYIDNLGNKNGRLDVGDLRAYLRSQGQLSEGSQP